MEKRNPRQSICAEITAEIKMNACKNPVPYISPHILTSKSYYFRTFFCKQSDKRFCVKKATFIHCYLNNAVLGEYGICSEI